MLIKSKAKERPSQRWALTCASAVLLVTTGGVCAQALPPSPLAAAPPQRGLYPSDVVVTETFRFFAGGRALPVTGDTAALVSRLGAPATATRDLDVHLIPGLELGPGNTVHLFKAPPAPRAELARPLVTAKLVTLHPVAYRGVPLAPGSDVLSIATATGKLLVARERNLPQSVDGSDPTVDREAAKRVAIEASRARGMPADAAASEPHLEVFVDRSAKGRLAWRIPVASASLTAPWARDIWIAAIGDPVVLADREAIYHAHNGHVTATAFPASPLGGSASQDLDAAFVTRTGSDGGQVITGSDGRYRFPSGVGNATLAVGVSGPNSRVDNVPGAEITATAAGPGIAPIDLSLNAATGEELAQTSAFVWVNRAHALAQDVLPLLAPNAPPNFLANLPTNVNIAANCNAFWNTIGKTLNFFQAGGGCVNTAYADVVLHEYGHGIDDLLGGILNGGYSEGFGDALALIGTRQPCLGRDFFGAGTCLRPATDVILWPPDTSEVHAIGRRYAGFAWALITELQNVYSPDAAFEVARQLVLGAAAANPGDIPDAVRLSFIADDDDGNLTTCSTHQRLLAAAADSRHIPRPADCVGDYWPRFMVDVNGDGRADYCRFVGIKPAIFLSCALAKSDNTFGNYDVNGKPGFPGNFDPGYSDMPHFMVNVNGDGRADYCRFVGNNPDIFLSCALAKADSTFGNYDVNGKPGFPGNFDPGYSDRPRFMADVNADGRADYCRFVGNDPDTFLSCALAKADNTFGNYDVNGKPGFPGNFDPGYSDRPHFMADVNADGRADYCRFVGNDPDTFLSCALAKADNTFGNYDVNGKPGFPGNFDPGYSDRPHFMADVNADGRADYCRFVGNDPDTFLSCALAKATFGNYDVNGKPGFPGNFDPGYSDRPRFMVDVNGDGRADYCRFVGNDPDTYLSCALAKSDNTFGNYDVNGKPGFPGNFDPGYSDMPHFMADVNGDGRADYCRFVGNNPDIFLSCALAKADSTFGNYDVNGKPGFPGNFDPGYPDRPS